MMYTNSKCVSQEGPVNALALNKDCTQVVIAGRNVFKVYLIGEEEFSEVCNLRGKNLNLNFSSIDVAWSAIEENTLATAATNGAVVVWNLGRSGRSKQEHVFSDHKRTVNKVSFHLTEPSLLISGSQDGTMKCFDLRMKEVARTFLSNTESIRDVQFSPHAAHTFAAVSENGSVQLWDVRRHERPLLHFAAHSGPVFACDWHPEVPWLATASRDKTIKIWDIHTKPSLEHTIYTIASVGYIKWRPQRKYHIASCALVLDSTVNVWDVRRPHIPLAMFAEHRDVTTAIAWQDDPTKFLSTSRDCTLYRHVFVEAAHPALWGAPHGLSVSARGGLTHAAPRAPPHHAHLARPATAPHASHATLFRKQPTAGSLTSVAQLALERAFPTSATSVVTRWGAGWSGDEGPMEYCARRYRTSGAAPHELAAHNAKVARDVRRYMVAHVWEVVSAVYARRPALPAPPPPAPPDPPHPAPTVASAVEEETPELEEEWCEWQFHNSGVLGMPTHTIYVPDGHAAENDGWVSAAAVHYVDEEAADWTLPEEAFHHALTHHPGTGRTTSTAASPGAVSTITTNNDDDKLLHPASLTQTEEPSNSVPLPPGYLTEAGGEEGALHVVRGGCGDHGDGEVWGAGGGGVVAAALRAHAGLGDVQTPATVVLVLGDRRNDVLSYIEESVQEQWLFGYIEILHRHKLYNIATEVIRSAWLYSVWQWSQQSSTVQMCCTRCGRACRAGGACDRCNTPPALCAVCNQIVHGLFAWCQGCAHGGHLLHMADWLKDHQSCPAGCGHLCQIP